MPLDLSNPPKPPPSKAGAKPGVRTPSAAKLSAREEAITGLFDLAGFGCMILRQFPDAMAINDNKQPIAHELAAIAATNDRFASSIDSLTAVGPYAALLTACLPLVLQLAANHNLVPAAKLAPFGVKSPALLEKQMEADLARKQHDLDAELRAMSETPDD